MAFITARPRRWNPGFSRLRPQTGWSRDSGSNVRIDFSTLYPPDRAYTRLS